jgi:hypothetical protein
LAPKVEGCLFSGHRALSVNSVTSLAGRGGLFAFVQTPLSHGEFSTPQMVRGCMAQIVEYQPTTLPNYMKVVQTLQRSAQHPLWFRGGTKLEYDLTPSLYRHPTQKTPGQLNELERKLMTRFRQRSMPYHSRNLSDDWEALFFMQHYGVPTRLLDWTENPLIGSRCSFQRDKRQNIIRKIQKSAPWYGYWTHICGIKLHLNTFRTPAAP